ncbi:hypothetical protein ANN_21505 [Periplaneta americana]|uniref:Uncharacterized protein n=1 Tax=Periplaneta americana TaxID=6978 RepID=A0ABQ8SFG5_PERAM|nr:hypothetical protein ANN_21505 [Periplaneta americana]
MLTYGCSVWVKPCKNRKNLNKLQRVQRIMNIKIAKAHRTLSFEASCVVAGVRPIGISIAESVKIYQATHESNEDPERLRQTTSSVRQKRTSTTVIEIHNWMDSELQIPPYEVATLQLVVVVANGVYLTPPHILNQQQRTAVSNGSAFGIKGKISLLKIAVKP